MPINQASLHLLLSRAQYDLGATQSAALIVAGDRLGLYRALANGPKSANELAGETKTSLRYVEGWLINQAASGYATYDAMTDTYSLTPEQSVALTDETSPYFLPAAFALAGSLAAAGDGLVQLMRGGAAAAPPAAALDAIDRMAAAKSTAVIDAILSPGVLSILERGGAVLDVGSGGGALLTALANRFPKLVGTGVDVRTPPAGAT